MKLSNKLISWKVHEKSGKKHGLSSEAQAYQKWDQDLYLHSSCFDMSWKSLKLQSTLARQLFLRARPGTQTWVNSLCRVKPCRGAISFLKDFPTCDSPNEANGESANPRIVSDWAKKKCTDFEIPEIHRISRIINRCNRNNMNELNKWQITTCVGPLLHPTTPLSCCLRNAKGETSTVLLKTVPDQNLWRRPKMSRICQSLQAHL